MSQPIVPNRQAELEAEIAALKAQLAMARDVMGDRSNALAAMPDGGKPAIPLRALRRQRMVIGFRFPGDMP